MLCSDPVRERFKFIDTNGSLKEDIGARNFIRKVYPPLHTVGQKIHENIVDKCKQDKEKKESDQFKLKIREEAAYNAWTNLRLIKNEDSNRKFRRELAILSNV